MPNISFYVGDSLIHGKGLFAKTFIPAGEFIGVIRGKDTAEDGVHVLWLNGQRGIRLQCNFRYINLQC